MLTAGAIITLERGHYRLREQIAGSAYGLIWRASGPHALREVALKLINEPQMALARAPQRQRWIASATNEITFLQSLRPWDERHIVRLLDSGQHRGLPVLALELMAGDLGSHTAALNDSGRSVPLAQTLDWLAQINQALAKVHQYGWRYLDLKPANVLLDAARGSVKLADFGTNRAAAETAPHTYAGTASWQAPEQFFPQPGGDTYATDERSDYFALGALFYFLVSGGTALRFCGACGQAYRDHHSGAAAMLLRQGGGAMPATLLAAEEALFTRRLGAAVTPAGAGAALTLLRALLEAAPARRPANALQISRMLAAVRAGLAP
ncbi:protein kinase domain-containing protein [Janthinobacterium sp.]|uniref:protein kinase domain-containing protein n=1 Tax=Janthinobacterium sp. TaxID=1871054 RepID=UPI00293D51C7|nr:protein kinase [Janthinobacterium sp.]